MATVYTSVSASVDFPFPNGFPTVTFENVDTGEYQLTLTNVFGIPVATLSVSVAAPVVQPSTPAVDPINATSEVTTNG